MAALIVLGKSFVACQTGLGIGPGGDGQVGPDAGPDAGLCGVGDDEKNLGQVSRIYHGTTTPPV